MMNSINSFIEIEKKYNMYRLVEDGCNYWVYCRFYIWNYLISKEKYNLNLEYQKNKKKNIFSYYLKKIYYILKNRKIFKNSSILFFTHERRIKINGYYKCIYTDYINELYTNTFSIELPYKNMHFEPMQTKRMMYLDYLLFGFSIYKKIINIFCKKKIEYLLKKIESEIKLPLFELEKLYEIRIDISNVKNLILSIIIHYNYFKPRFIEIISKINPKVIVEVVYYDFYKMLLNEIAKEREIPTIELQHGNIYLNHSAYQFNTKEMIKQLPDRIFTFSSYWKNQINVPIVKNNIVPVGFPFFDMMKRCYPKKHHDRYTILFISQGTIGIHLSYLAIELSKKLSKSKYRIIFRLHPSEFNDFDIVYKDLKNTWVEISSNREETLYQYYAISDMQIGVYSTAIYEGIGYELKTLIYKIGQYKDMQNLVKNKYAEYISNVEDIIKIINEEEKRIYVQVNHFWKENALVNIKKEIDKYLK